jgi:hypothetical protein
LPNEFAEIIKQAANEEGGRPSMMLNILKNKRRQARRETKNKG